MSKDMNGKQEVQSFANNAMAAGNVLESVQVIVSDITNMVNMIQQETTKREIGRASCRERV